MDTLPDGFHDNEAAELLPSVDGFGDAVRQFHRCSAAVLLAKVDGFGDAVRHCGSFSGALLECRMECDCSDLTIEDFRCIPPELVFRQTNKRGAIFNAGHGVLSRRGDCAVCLAKIMQHQKDVRTPVLGCSALGQGGWFW